jgi:hypothetical protein
MLRQKTPIATGKIDSRLDYDYSYGMTFYLFGIEDGSSKIYDLYGRAEVEIKVKRNGKFIDVNVENLQNKDKK